MRRLVAILALALSAPPLAAQDGVAKETPGLGLEQAMQLRCSAAFGIIAGEQARGVESAKAWPPLGERGREFFVRAAAAMMDDLGLTREQVQALLKAEVARLQDDAMNAADPAAYIDSVMQPCLLALDGSGL
jgi:hypothetical protein